MANRTFISKVIANDPTYIHTPSKTSGEVPLQKEKKKNHYLFYFFFFETAKNLNENHYNKDN